MRTPFSLLAALLALASVSMAEPSPSSAGERQPLPPAQFQPRNPQSPQDTSAKDGSGDDLGCEPFKGAGEMALSLALAVGLGVASILFLREVSKDRTSALLIEVRLRKERERELEREKRFVESVIESLPVYFYLHDGRRFLHWNSAFQRGIGLSDEELGSIHPRMLVHEDDRALASQKRDEIFEQGEAQWETRVLTGAGVRYHYITGKRMKVEGTVYAVGTATDITDRKLAEQALVESEDHVRQIFAQSDDGLILFKMDTFEIIEANPAALTLFGVEREALRDLRPWSLISQVDFCKLIRLLSRGDRAAGFQLERGTCYRTDGSTFIVAIRGKVLTMRNEYVILCSIRDITEKVRLEDEMKATQARLIQANKMTSLGMLVSGVAHEINNPNNFISVNSVMLSDVWRAAYPILKEYRDRNGEFDLGGLPFSEMEGVVPRLLTGITDGSTRIATIVRNMRNFVKKDDGGVAGVIDVNRTIDSAASLLWHHIHRHTDSFVMSLAEELPPARGSAQQIEQVIINLIINALQALPGKDFGVRVESGVDPASGMIRISVIDEGYGMKKKVLKHLTEPFFSTKIDKGGTGLGLYISSSIIKEHEGTLTFDSAPGKGTTATILLPVSDAERLPPVE